MQRSRSRQLARGVQADRSRAAADRFARYARQASIAAVVMAAISAARGQALNPGTQRLIITPRLIGLQFSQQF